MIQSLTFWAALAATSVVYWLLPARFRNGFLFAASFGYLATLDPFSVAALLVLTLIFHRLAPRLTAGTLRSERLLVGLILAAALFLAAFKYMPPLLYALTGNQPAAFLLIPLGISYYTFKLIHYAIEVSREAVEPGSLGDFLAYMFLFPTFTAGPIERFDHFVDHREVVPSVRMVVEGGTRIVVGIVKAGFVSEILKRGLVLGVPNSDYLLSHLELISTPRVWLVVLRGYLAVYVGFSAYSDIAIGASRLFGIGIMENFNFPVLARNMSDYWQRWHMSLSGWCRAYVYMPALGATRNPYLAMHASFLVMGMWHAGTATRLAWGLWHAWGSIGYAVWASYRRRRGWFQTPNPLSIAVSIVLTQAYVLGSWAILIGEDGGGLPQGLRVLAKLFFINVG